MYVFRFLLFSVNACPLEGSWKPRRATKVGSGAHIRVSEIEIDTTAIWVHKNQIYENEIKLFTSDEQI